VHVHVYVHISFVCMSTHCVPGVFPERGHEQRACSRGQQKTILHIPVLDATVAVL